VGLGKDSVERWVYGSVLGIAGAIYLAVAASQIDLRGFYPAWGVVALVCLLARLRRRGSEQDRVDPAIVFVLIVVGVARFAVALPRELPEGPFDPTIHLILCGKIQETQHAVRDWQPFDSIPTNYPTGAHTLIVVLSAISRLPLHTVFKDMVPLLGVLSTGIVYVFVRRASSESSVAIWSAAAYGMWAWFGSNDYFRWGGLPNETGMLLFMAFMALALEAMELRRRVALMSVVYASLLVTHHHTMIVSGMIICAAIVFAADLRKVLILSAVGAVVLGFFFVIPYAMKIRELHSTPVLYDSEGALTAGQILAGIGLVNAPAALAGIGVWIGKRTPRFHAMFHCGAVCLAGAFIATEYAVPLVMKMLGHSAAIAFAPSRFLTDLNYFLAIFAGVFVWWVQRSLLIERGWLLAVMCGLALVSWNQWQDLARPPESASPPEGFMLACQWIHDHTSPSTVVLNRDNWTTYLTWRRATFTPIPGSDPIPDHGAEWEHLMNIMAGRIPPDGPGMTMVKIVPENKGFEYPEVWRGAGYKVVQVWPGGR
jgi:hypothetical protein